MPNRTSDAKIVDAFAQGHSIETIMYFWGLRRETVDQALRAALPSQKGRE